MFTKDFDKILSNWESLIKETNILFEEGHRKFLEASKSYFEGMKSLSELSGNFPLSHVYKTLSKTVKDYTEKYEKK